MSTPNPIPTINPATGKFNWNAPTTNDDGTPIQTGEITGYDIGIRSAGSGAAGTYPIITNVPDPTDSDEAVSEIGQVLKPDTYAAAIRTTGPVNSFWSSEIQFIIAAPKPNPPSGFAVS